MAMVDAINRTGRAIVISTEPFSLVPTPLQGEISHLYRTTNDVEASYSSSMNRADLNANWLRLAGPGRWADPDCVMCGHVGEAECRSIFAVFAVSKAPLLLGAVVQNFTAETLATVTNAGVIAVNQDALGAPGRKLAAGGRVSPAHVGLAPCTAAGAAPGVNGAAAAELLWTPRVLRGAGANATIALVHDASGRCLATQPYMKRVGQVPVLLPCDAADETQAWVLVNALTVTNLVNVKLNMSLAAAESTVWGALHGKDNATLLDAAYGITNLTFEATVLPPPCTDRDCDGYEPRQSWYWSPSTRRLSLALFSANMYRCYEGASGCYDFAGAHLPAVDDFCLSRVLAISNDGLDTAVGGVHVWGGPLAGGAFVVALENRGADAPAAAARWAWLEAPGVGDATAFCVRELYSDKMLGVFTGGIALPVAAHDAVVLRLSAGAAC